LTSNSFFKINGCTKAKIKSRRISGIANVFPGMPLSGEARANVERIYNEAVTTRIDLSKFNLD
jgi:4-hydroxy-tetrahydrodipicolinate synthase